MKRLLWTSLVAITLVGMIQTVEAKVTSNTIDTPGLTNHDSFEPFSTAGATFTDSDAFESTYQVDFDSPQNYIRLLWSVGVAPDSEGLEFLGFVNNPYPGFAVEFHKSDGTYDFPLASSEGYDGGIALADDFYRTVIFSISDVYGRYRDATGNVVILGQPVRIDQFSYGIDTSLMVPEPETNAMLFTGLGMLGWVARRRKKLPTA